MDDHAKSQLDPLVEALQVRLPGLIAVYRFGSFGTPEERLDSDIKEKGSDSWYPHEFLFKWAIAALSLNNFMEAIDGGDYISKA